MTINPYREQRRQDYLDALYLMDGRDCPTHALHSRYTGLYTNHVSQLLAGDIDHVLSTINPRP